MDREALLEVENAVLRTITRYESILRPEALEELLDVLHRYITFALGGITTSDGPGGFRALSSPDELADGLIPYRARLPSSPEIYEIVYVQGRPLHRRELKGDTNPIDRLARRVGVGSYSIFPIQASSARQVGTPGETRIASETIATLWIGYTEPDANDRFPPDLAERICGALSGSVERGLEATREHRALRILDTSGDAMVAWDSDGRITDLNLAAEGMTGATRAQLLGCRIEEVLGKRPAGRLIGERFTLTSRGGESMTVSATVSPVQGDPLVTAHALLRDLSQVVAAEKKARAHLADLKALSEQHTTLLDNAPIVIFRLDPVTRELLYLNRHAERLFGVTAETALETPGFLRALHVDPEGRAAFEAAVDMATEGSASLPYEARLGHGGEEPITARGTIYPIVRSEGDHVPVEKRVVGIEGVLLDITSEREARTRLVQADRLATVGLLAAGVAHEINNPAAFMLLGLDALGRQLEGPNVTLTPPADVNVQQLVNDLRETGKRIVKIARDMRLFARPPGAGRPVAVDVARTIDSALTITRAQIIEKAEIVLDVDAHLPPVLMEEGRLGQVLVNLLVNAAQSFPERKLGEPRSNDVVRISARPENRSVVITIEDTGAGIPKAVMARLFTPFFSTKGNDAGTGLGLAISRGIVESAGGTISGASPAHLTDPPRGARFVVTLPAYAEELLTATSGAPAVDRQVGG